jgi:hypothetical protein
MAVFVPASKADSVKLGPSVKKLLVRGESYA